MNIDDLSGLTSKVKEHVNSNLKSKIEQIDRIFRLDKETPKNFNVDLEVLLHIFNCLANRHAMLNEIGPFALLMHSFVRTIDTFKDLEVSREEFCAFKESVRDTIEQVIGRYETLQ